MPDWFDTPGRSAQRWISEWWQLAQLGSVILVLALSPSTYNQANRDALALHVYRNTAPILVGFTVISALVALVITRIVLVTAMSYGLSHYALQVVIRVLVLELIPLTAALFIALRCTIPDGAELTAMRAQAASADSGNRDTLQGEVIARVMAGMFSGITLAALSSVLVLVVAYLSSYGFSVAGFAAFTRLFGQVFSPAVTVIFVLKTLLFCLTVSLIPMASALFGADGQRGNTVRTSMEMRGLVRMFAVVLLVEVFSLVGNYY